MHDWSCVIAFQKFPFLSRNLSLSIQKLRAVVGITTFQILEIQNAYLFKRTYEKSKWALPIHFICLLTWLQHAIYLALLLVLWKWQWVESKGQKTNKVADTEQLLCMYNSLKQVFNLACFLNLWWHIMGILWLGACSHQQFF